MKIKSLFQQIASATRSEDWRLSFVPFIIACVYLWSSLFALEFSSYHIIILLLSVCTTFGFAAFGYFINEFFDKKDDLIAGKINKLSLLSLPKQFLLFLFISILCFSPWLFLPADANSYWLILAEIASFLLYSLPFFRLKKSIFFAGILDALYAYLLPGLLSFHTYALVSGLDVKIHPVLFFVSIFFIGYRNIFLHQIKDVLGDKKAKLKTLPQYLGVNKSYNFLKILYLLEISLLLAFSIELIIINKIYAPWFVLVVLYLIYVRKDLRKLFKEESYFALLPVQHVLDLLYQLFFPLLQLLLLLWIDWRWIVIVPFHLLLFVKRDFITTFYGLVLKYAWHRSLRPFISAILNYPIYLLFKIFGVDLIKENKSALTYLKNKLK